MARTAFDTGFLVKYLAGHPAAREIFIKVMSGTERPVLPSPVYFELETLVLRGKILREKWAKFREIIRDLTEFYPLDEKACTQAARLKHTFGLSSVDAMIAGIALAGHCKVLLTTDRASLANRLRHAKIGLKIKVVL